MDDLDPTDPQQTTAAPPDPDALAKQLGGTSAPIPRPDAEIAQAQQHVDHGKAIPHPIIAKILDWLPAAEATAGGIVGGAGGTVLGFGVGGVPGAIGLAGLGGMAGEAQKELINRWLGNTAPASSTEAATNIGTEGAKQAVLQAAIPAAGAIGRVVAPGLMRSALAPGVKVLEKTGELELGTMPEMVKATLDAGGSVTPSGVQAIGAAKDAATLAKNTIVANLGGKVSPTAVQDLAQGYADSLLIKSDKKSAQKVIDNFTDQFVRDPATGQMRPWLDPTTADALKTQQTANINYGTMAKPAIQARKVLGSGLRQGLEALDTATRLAQKTGLDVPTLASANTATGNLIDATKAAARANAMWQNKPLAMRVYAAITGRSPAVNSLIARGLYRQAEKVAGLATGTLRVLDGLLQSDDSGGQQ